MITFIHYYIKSGIDIQAITIGLSAFRLCFDLPRQNIGVFIMFDAWCQQDDFP